MKLENRQIDDLHQLSQIEWKGAPHILAALDAAYVSHIDFLVTMIRQAGRRIKKPFLPKSFAKKLGGAA